MKTNGTHNYYAYILTNAAKNVLYTGVTNSIETRLAQHRADAYGEKKTFAGKYNWVFLLYVERFQYIQDAIAREKEIKSWSRAKKEVLITSVNPNWDFLNKELDI